VSVSVHSVAINDLKLEKQPDRARGELRLMQCPGGIPKESQHVLFQAFNQIDPATTRKHEGIGREEELVEVIPRVMDVRD
jgi:signal transduction histidine kinase